MEGQFLHLQGCGQQLAADWCWGRDVPAPCYASQLEFGSSAGPVNPNLGKALTVSVRSPHASSSANVFPHGRLDLHSIQDMV